MTDTLELEFAIKRVGLTRKEIALKLGISQMGLFNKINNITEFKASEIDKLADLLNLDVKKRDRIFLHVMVINNHRNNCVETERCDEGDVS